MRHRATHSCGAALVLGMAQLTLPASVRAQEPQLSDAQQACVTAYVDAQKLRRDGKLSAARDQLIACAQEVCPQTLRSQCAPWLEELDRVLPSVVFIARDAAGQDTTQVRVELDGQPWLDQVPPRAVPLDPGAHQLRALAADGAVLEQALVIREGERNRQVELDFSTPAPADPQRGVDAAPVSAATSDEPRLFSLPVLISGGLSAAALASFVGFGLSGKLWENELANTCAPNCEQRDVDDIHLRFLIADVSLGAALLGAAAAALFLLLPESADAGAPAPVDPPPG